MERETKTVRIDKKSTFFYFFIYKNSGYKKSKTPIFERGCTNFF